MWGVFWGGGDPLLEAKSHFQNLLTTRSQLSSLIAYWLLVPGDSVSNPGRGENLSSFVFESRSPHSDLV